MPVSRRTLLSVVATSSLIPGLARAAGDPRMDLRAVGSPTAKVTVIEYMSLTCTHCAHFSMDTMPEVEKKLIKPGTLRIVYRDFPLDGVALMAAMVARALPPAQYYPFITALFASQDRWAFAQGINYTDELWKMAALAGMDRKTFDATIADQGLKKAVLAEQLHAEQKYKVNSTPTFIINGKPEPGAMSYSQFAKLVKAASA